MEGKEGEDSMIKYQVMIVRNQNILDMTEGENHVVN